MRIRMLVAAVVGAALAVMSFFVIGSIRDGETDGPPRVAADVAPPQEHSATGRLMVFGTFGGDDGRCENLPTPNRSISCYLNSLSQMDKLKRGKTFPAPRGPGGGYSDLRDGSPFMITDGAGMILHAGALSDGTLSYDGVEFQLGSFSLPDSDFYNLQIGNRAPVPMSREALEASGWNIDIGIGR